MIELVMLVCLTASPDRCEEKHQQFTEATLMQCMMFAPPYLAQWVDEHPNTEIKRWHCDIPGRKGQAT